MANWNQQNFPRSVVVANPAAGADFSVTVPASTRWQIQSIYAKFTASATVINRFPSIKITDGTNVLFDSGATTTVLASSTLEFNFIPGLGSFTSAQGNQQSVGPLPTGLLCAGWVISSNTANLQAGDQWSAIAFNVNEWVIG